MKSMNVPIGMMINVGHFNGSITVGMANVLSIKYCMVIPVLYQAITRQVRAPAIEVMVLIMA